MKLQDLLRLPPSPARNAEVRLLAARFDKSPRAIRGRIRHARLAAASGRYSIEEYGPDLRLVPLTPARILALEPIRELSRASHGEKCSTYAKAAAGLGLNEMTLRRIVRSAKVGRGLLKQGKSAIILRRLSAKVKEIPQVR